MARIIHSAARHDLPVSLCGEMSSDPAAVALLLGMGIRSLSMSAAHVPRIKSLIRRVDMAQMQQLCSAVSSMDDAGEIRAFVEKELPA
ncbi:MAG: hypothetical protein HKN19_01295 [Halioglobus sp.]|nr:hypothetical protein [Halioglobus sp.]